MKRIASIIALLLVVGYFANSYIQDQAEREAQRLKSDRLVQVTRSLVSEMASRTNAVTDWEQHLGKGETVRLEPILTLELERLWMQQGPILFTGAIQDIATHDHTNYVVLIERSLFGNSDYMFGTDLQLSLLSDKDTIDHFLQEHPDLFKTFGLKNSVAVVARIDSISTTYFLGEDGDREEIKIGDGTLLKILYTGDVFF